MFFSDQVGLLASFESYTLLFPHQVRILLPLALLDVVLSFLFFLPCMNELDHPKGYLNGEGVGEGEGERDRDKELLWND